MVSFSSHHEFEYKVAYPAAIAGELLTLPTHGSLKLLGHVVSPLRPDSKAKSIVKKIVAVALAVLSLPYSLTFGLLGLLLTTLTTPFRKNVVLISPRMNQAEAPPHTLKVCTFNTALLPDIINSLKPNVPESHIKPMEGTTEERVCKIAHEILQRQDDIICLQEVLEPKAARLLAQKLSPVYPHAAFNVGATGLFLNSGLMVVSKYPLEKPVFIPFTESRGADSWAKKGVLGLTVVLPGQWKVNVLNTHLNSDAGLFGWKNGVGSTRDKQLEQVKKLADTYTDETEQTLICGDLNRQDIWEMKGYKISQASIDYILLSERLTYQLAELAVTDPMNDVSDHPALRVKLAF